MFLNCPLLYNISLYNTHAVTHLCACICVCVVIPTQHVHFHWFNK